MEITLDEKDFLAIVKRLPKREQIAILEELARALARVYGDPDESSIDCLNRISEDDIRDMLSKEVKQ